MAEVSKFAATTRRRKSGDLSRSAKRHSGRSGRAAVRPHRVPGRLEKCCRGFLGDLVSSKAFKQRSDRKWVFPRRWRISHLHSAIQRRGRSMKHASLPSNPSDGRWRRMRLASATLSRWANSGEVRLLARLRARPANGGEVACPVASCRGRAHADIYILPIVSDLPSEPWPRSGLHDLGSATLLGCQAGLARRHGVPRARMALRMTGSLRMQAVIASFLALPTARRRSHASLLR